MSTGPAATLLRFWHSVLVTLVQMCKYLRLDTLYQNSNFAYSDVDSVYLIDAFIRPPFRPMETLLFLLNQVYSLPPTALRFTIQFFLSHGTLIFSAAPIQFVVIQCSQEMQ